MCGIQAFIGKKNKKVDLNKFKKLMLWNALGRGQEATGVFSKENGIIKDNDRCDIFLSKNEIKPDSLIVGHVRASTFGGNTKENAHPFTCGNITLVHNGTLTNPWAWARHHNIDSTKISVDSDVICHILNKEQNFDVLGEINGAAALVMHDSKTPNKLYVYRNKDRELFYGKCSYGMYISSIKASLESIGCTEIAEFPVGTLHTIENGEIKATKEITIKPYETPTYSYTSSSNNSATQHTPKNLIGRWLYCDSSFTNKCENGTSITSDNYYKCVGVTDEVVDDFICNTKRNYVYILDNNNIKRKVDFYVFDNYVTNISVNDYLLILSDLHTTDMVDGKEVKNVVLKKDQIVILTDEKEVEGKLSVCDGNAEWNVPKGSVRKLSYNDEWDGDNHNKINNLDAAYTKYKDNKKKQSELPISNKKEDNKEEDEDEDDYVYVDIDILVNNDFQYIKDQLDEIMQNIHSVSIFNVKDAIRELEYHIDNCISEYTEIAAEQGVVFFEDDKQSKYQMHD